MVHLCRESVGRQRLQHYAARLVFQNRREIVDFTNDLPEIIMINPLSGVMQSRASFRLTILISLLTVVLCYGNAHAQSTQATPIEALSISKSSAMPSTSVTGSDILTSGGHRTSSDSGSLFLLAISTNLGTTYHKGASGQKVSDGYNSDGSFNVTTDDPFYGITGNEAFTLTYSATPSGVWSKGSIYTWGSTASGISSGTRPSYTGATGAFDPGAIPDLLVYYNQNAIKSGTTAGTDQIKISATDKATGTQEHGKFDVTFYPLYCNWQRTNEPPTYNYTPFSGSKGSGNDVGYPVPVGSASISWQLLGQTVSGIIGGCSGVLTIVHEPAWWLTALAEAAGSAISDVPRPAQTQMVVFCNQDQLQSDYNVQLEVIAKSVPVGTPPYPTMSEAMQNEMATKPNLQALLNDRLGEVYFTPRVYIKTETWQWSADSYGPTGYIGSVDVPWTVAMASIVQGYWDFVPNYTSRPDN
jgi:hypothetical protein